MTLCKRPFTEWNSCQLSSTSKTLINPGRKTFGEECQKGVMPKIKRQIYRQVTNLRLCSGSPGLSGRRPAGTWTTWRHTGRSGSVPQRSWTSWREAETSVSLPWWLMVQQLSCSLIRMLTHFRNSETYSTVEVKLCHPSVPFPFTWLHSKGSKMFVQ